MNKLRILFSCLFIFSISCVYGQAENLFEGKYISYKLLTESLPNLIFDSTVVKASKFQIVEINISDSLFYASLSSQEKKNKKSYSESFFLDFSHSGHLSKGEYTLVTPRYNYSTELKWKYDVNFELLTTHNQIASGPYPRNSDKVVLTKFNPLGDATYCKTWGGFSGVSNPSDTTLYDFINIDEYYYDQEFILTRMSSSTYFKDSLLYSSSSKVLFHQKTANSIFYKTQKNGDSLFTTIKTVFDNSHHLISKTYCYNDDSLEQTMKYDAKGNLIYFLNNTHSWMNEEYLITRDENGLPSKIIFHGLNNTVTFNFKWG